MEKFFDVLKTMPIPFNFITIVGIFAIVFGVFYLCYTAYLNNALKRDMLNKGMSAEEIERVLNAGKSMPEMKGHASGPDAAGNREQFLGS